MRVRFIAVVAAAVVALSGCSINFSPDDLTSQVKGHPSSESTSAVTAAMFGSAPRLVDDATTIGTWTLSSATANGRRAEALSTFSVAIAADGVTGTTACGTFTSPVTAGVIFPLTPTWLTTCTDDEVVWVVNTLAGQFPSSLEGSTLVIGDDVTEIVLTRG